MAPIEIAPAPDHVVVSEVCTHDVSYSYRVNNPDEYNWCLVPHGGADAVFFAGIAILCMCLAWPKYDAIIVLLLGAGYEALAYAYNLGHVSNAASLWLGIRPADIFVFIFLPPFLLDAAVKIDYFMLKKRTADILILAFVIVVASCLLLIPLLLDALDLKSEGWTATEVALFGACIASTDAASVGAVLSSSGAPEILTLILEGESLFNDASSLTLFSIFIELMHTHKSESLDAALTNIVVGLLWAIFTGIAIGLLSGLFTLLTFMWMQHRNLDAKAEVAFTVGMAYLSFFIAQVFCKGSGCVATVVFGLFGSATLLFGMSQQARQSLIFPQFWDVFMFLVNSLIFFYVGAASVNFAIRSGQSLYPSGLGSLFALTLYRLPIIWLASFALRGILLFASSHCLKLMRLSEGLGWKDIIFITVGGLRGSLSLVLAQAVAAEQGDEALTEKDRKVRAQMAILITGFVILTLLVNAPLCGPLLTLLKLDKVSEESILMRRHVKDLLAKFAATSLAELQENEDDDEMLQGVDWTEVREKLDMHKELDVALSEEQPFIDWLAPFRWCGDSFKAMRERLTSGDCLRGGTGMTPEEREKNLNVMRDMHRASALHDIHRASALREIHRASAIQERAPYFSQNPARTQGGNQEGSGLILIIGESDNASPAPYRSLKSIARSGSKNRALSGGSSNGVWSIFSSSWMKKSNSNNEMGLQSQDSDTSQMQMSQRAATGPGGSSLKRSDSRRLLSRKSSRQMSKKHSNLTARRGMNPSFNALSKPSAAASSSRRLDPALGVDDEVASGGRGSSSSRQLPLSPRFEDRASVTRSSLLVIKANPQGKRRPGSSLAAPSASVLAPDQDDQVSLSSGGGASVGALTMTRKLVQRGGVVEEMNVRTTSAGAKVSKSSKMMQKLALVGADSTGSLGTMSRNLSPTAVEAVGQEAPWIPPFESPPGHEFDGFDSFTLPPPPQIKPLSQSQAPEVPAAVRALKQSNRSLAARSTSLLRPTFSPIDEDRSVRPEAAVRGEKPLGRSSTVIAGPIGEKSLGRSSATIVGPVGEKPLGRTSTLMGGGRRGQTNSALAALAATDWSGTKKPGQPFLFESPPGHEDDGMHGLSMGPTSPSSKKAERGLSTRSVGFVPRGVSPFQQEAVQNTASRHRLAMLGGEVAAAAAAAAAPALENTLSRQLTAERAYEMASTKLSGSSVRPLDRSSALVGPPAETLEAPSNTLTRRSTGISQGQTSNMASPRGSSSDLHSMGQNAEAAQQQSAYFGVSPQTINEDEELKFIPRPDGIVDEEKEAEMAEEAQAKEESLMLQEFRMRLLSGLRQCYQAKYDEGTLGPRAFLILSHVIDNAHHYHHLPLDLWDRIRNEIGHGLLMRMEVSSYYWMKSRHTRFKASANPLTRYILPPLLVGPMWLCGRDLHNAMLVSLETAAELWISLTDGLQTSWLSYAGDEGETLMAEVKAQVDSAYQFIVERRIESPEAFAALQTHRALILLLSQQQTFVREMTQGGLIGAAESRRLLEVLDARAQKVRKRGPRTKKRGVREILADVNFLRDVDDKVVDWLRRQGSTKIFARGEVIWEPLPSIPDVSKTVDMSFKASAFPSLGTFIVISGVVRMELEFDTGVEPVYLGAGGVGGLVATLLGGTVPGMNIVGVYAEGNALGKGPVVLRLPQALFTAIEHLSRDEKLASYQKLEVAMFKTASTLILDLLKLQVLDQLWHYMLDSITTILKDDEATFISRRTRLKALVREGVVSDEFQLPIELEAMDVNVWVNELVRLHQISPLTAIELLERGEPDEESWGDLEEDEKKIPNQVWQAAMFQAINRCIQGIFELIKGSVRSESSRLICLSPGQVVYQHLTMVLIQGSLCAQEEDAAPVGASLPPPQPPRRNESSRQPHFIASPNESHVAPSVMVWIPDFWGSQLHDISRGARIKAGVNGATLLLNVPEAMDISAVMSRP